MFAQKILSRFLPVMVLGIFFYLAGATQASAQYVPNGDLDGYAWSSTIGWISLNCRTGGVAGGNVCATSNYKVTINSTSSITGYAWSSNVGWIKFGGLSSFPAGGGTTAVNARVTGSYPNYTFEGWARACAGTTTGTCSVMTDSTSGWDGWISLEGTNYRILTRNGGIIPNSVSNPTYGYAWGSDVVGWIDWFSEVKWLNPSSTISVTRCRVSEGNSTCNATTTWDIDHADAPNIRNTATNDHYASSSSGTNRFPIRIGTNRIVARDNDREIGIPLNLNLSSSTVDCDTGLVITGATCEFPPPTVTISSDKPIIRKGDQVTIDWTISPNPLPASSVCTLSGPAGLTGGVTVTGNRTSTALNSTSVFRISCSNPSTYGTVEDTVRVEMIPTSQEV